MVVQLYKFSWSSYIFISCFYYKKRCLGPFWTPKRGSDVHRRLKRYAKYAQVGDKCQSQLCQFNYTSFLGVPRSLLAIFTIKRGVLGLFWTPKQGTGVNRRLKRYEIYAHIGDKCQSQLWQFNYTSFLESLDFYSLFFVPKNGILGPFWTPKRESGVHRRLKRYGKYAQIGVKCQSQLWWFN